MVFRLRGCVFYLSIQWRVTGGNLSKLFTEYPFSNHFCLFFYYYYYYIVVVSIVLLVHICFLAAYIGIQVTCIGVSGW